MCIRDSRWNWGAILRKGLEMFTVPFLTGCLWWVRNLVVYGWPDFLGTGAHDSAVVGQPTTAEWIEQFGVLEVGRRFVQTTFRSFWGQFGWMEVVMPRWVYLTLALFSVIVLLGFLALIVMPGRKDDTTSAGTLTRSTLFTPLITLFIFNLALYLAYNITFVQHQVRYFFSSLVPISVAVSIGIWHVIGQNTILKQLPESFWGYLLSTGLIGLNLLALFRFIIPAL